MLLSTLTKSMGQKNLTMRTMLSKGFGATLFLMLFSCSVMRPTPQHVDFGDRKTLAFTGKGAAAGMMMDAYLGGAGVAIGIAIDEGIAKDIEKNLSQRAGGFDMLQLVRAELHLVKYKKQDVTNIVLDTYGFKTYPGEGDKVTAWLKIRFSGKAGEVILNYPGDFADPNAIALNEAKSNPDAAYKLLQDAVSRVFMSRFSNTKAR